jgi:UDPglucose 6-dehydrogenase
VKVGFVGLGRLGLPVALAIEDAGHEVAGWDTSPERRADILHRRVREGAHEPQLEALLNRSHLPRSLTPLSELGRWADVVMVCVQTPHEPEFEGCVPLTRAPQDFDYSFLACALADLHGATALVNVVSTCLPGTFERLRHHRGVPARMSYNPLFIAQGSVIADFRNPEFVLIGCQGIPSELVALYRSVCGSSVKIKAMSATSAELAKVSYNSIIGAKIALANTVAMLADATGADATDVSDALRCATDRLVSDAYMSPGLGDGGGCHPRDNIALSWLARSCGVHDLFGDLVRAREAHARWLADVWIKEADACGHRLVMLGAEYKADTNITTGSAARLVEHYVRCRGREPEVRRPPGVPVDPCCFLWSTPHSTWHIEEIAADSVVVDPWGSFPGGVAHVVRPGRRPGHRRVTNDYY